MYLVWRSLVTKEIQKEVDEVSIIYLGKSDLVSEPEMPLSAS